MFENLLALSLTIWVACNFLSAIVLGEGIERRFKRKCLTRLDIILMVVFFPMTILISLLISNFKLFDKVSSFDKTKKVWRWLNTPIKEKRR